MKIGLTATTIGWIFETKRLIVLEKRKCINKNITKTCINKNNCRSLLFELITASIVLIPPVAGPYHFPVLVLLNPA